MPNWLCVSPPETFLSEAESLFAQRKLHSGLAYSDCCLHQSHYPSPPPTSQPYFPNYYGSKIDVQTITNAERINLHLIRSCALLACQELSRGLIATDTALQISEKLDINYLVRKSQLYRGLNLMELKCWREPSFAFTRAGTVRRWHAKVNGLKRKEEKKVERQDKSIDEVGEGKQGNVIWKEMLGRMGVEKRSEREVGTEDEGNKD
jgi:hypothetical protein